MADKIKDLGTDKLTTDQIGQYVDELIRYSLTQRKSFERRWYDNNFFDDGFHYRYLQRSTGKIVDLSDQSSVYNPLRAIPKASKQIRGVTNLLVSSDPTPVVYPERVSKARFNDEAIYQQAVQIAKNAAKKRGFWLEQEFKKQEISEKLALLSILAAKHGVSWLQIWPDAVDEMIRTQVYDAFDIYTDGTITDPEDAPFMGKGVKKLISQIKADERFDKDQLEKISPDNKMASSEIKEAYMNSRFGKESNPDSAATLILKEVYMKEYLNSLNIQRIRMQDDGDKILKGREEGDPIIRQVFVAGNVWLRDRYVNLDHYPFVDFRFEPGQIYQVPLIERFIPSNKSLDAAVSRVERFMHTMNVGIWLKRSGEQFKVSNAAGGQIIEYEGTPPVQGNLAPMPNYVFDYISLLNSFIEEQGVSTTTLGKIPAGVKAAAAIESLKESEYATLVVASRRMKRTVQTIAERMLEIADEYFVTPQEIEYLDKGKPDYFMIIGDTALEGRKKLKVDTPEDVITIKKDLKVDVEVQSGSAFTREGKRELAKQLIDTMVQFTQLGVLPPETLKVAVEQWLQDFGFGATSEFMDAWEKGAKEGGMQDANIEQLKVAIMEVMKDLVSAGVLPTQEQRIEEGKVATAQVLKDSQLMEATSAEAQQEMKLKEEEHDQKMSENERKMQIEEAKARLEMLLKKQAAEQANRIKEEESASKMKMQEKQVKIQAKQAEQQKGDQNGDEPR